MTHDAPSDALAQFPQGPVGSRTDPEVPPVPGFVVTQNIIQIEGDAKVSAVCVNAEWASKINGDMVSLAVIKLHDDKVTVIEAANTIYANLTPQTRGKTLGTCMKEQVLPQSLFTALKTGFGTNEETPIGDVLLRLRRKGTQELNAVAAARGTAAAAMQSLLANATAVQELTNEINKQMKKVLDEDSGDEAEEEAWRTSKKVMRYRKQIDKLIVGQGKELAAAINAIPVDSPEILDALTALQVSAVNMPADHVKALQDYQRDQTEMNKQEKEIDDLQEAVQKVRNHTFYTTKMLTHLGTQTAEKKSLLRKDEQRLMQELQDAEKTVFASELQPPNGRKEYAEVLKQRKQKLKEKQTHLLASDAHTEFSPSLPTLDTRDLDENILRAQRSIVSVTGNPAMLRCHNIPTTQKVLGRETKVIFNGEIVDENRQRARVQQAELARDQAEAAKLARIASHNEVHRCALNQQETAHNSRVKQRKAQLDAVKAELKEAETELKNLDENDAAASEQFKKKEEERKQAFEQKKTTDLEERRQKLAKIRSDIEGVDKSGVKEEAKMENDERDAQAHIATLVKDIADRNKQLLEVKNRVGEMKTSVDKAMQSVGGFTSALFDVLDSMKASHAAVVDAGTKTASMTPMFKTLLDLFQPMVPAGEDDTDWASWKIEMNLRVGKYNEYVDTGLLLLDPRKVSIDINQRSGTRRAIEGGLPALPAAVGE